MCQDQNCKIEIACARYSKSVVVTTLTRGIVAETAVIFQLPVNKNVKILDMDVAFSVIKAGSPTFIVRNISYAVNIQALRNANYGSLGDPISFKNFEAITQTGTPFSNLTNLRFQITQDDPRKILDVYGGAIQLDLDLSFDADVSATYAVSGSITMRYELPKIEII